MKVCGLCTHCQKRTSGIQAVYPQPPDPIFCHYPLPVWKTAKPFKIEDPRMAEKCAVFAEVDQAF